jgi:hypothetical protein
LLLPAVSTDLESGAQTGTHFDPATWFLQSLAAT